MIKQILVVLLFTYIQDPFKIQSMISHPFIHIPFTLTLPHTYILFTLPLLTFALDFLGCRAVNRESTTSSGWVGEDLINWYKNE
jgi:hypothetical protein